MKISLIVTVKNEGQTISKLLESIANQTRKPDEIIITDAGSTDRTWTVARDFGLNHLQLLGVGNVNRATGRNKAIAQSEYDHILITDAGCRLKEDWVEEMEKGFAQADVVAGFYQGEYANIFEKCEIPYVLVMPDKIDPNNFLPATRSMGITKKLFHALGEFNEAYRYAEDYEFARRIQSHRIPIAVRREAVVYWRPRHTLVGFAKMIGEHAFGDGYSHTWRPKVGLIYIRYVVFIVLAWVVPMIGAFLFFLYLMYSIKKNYHNVQHWKAFIYLPLLQVLSDGMVIWGTSYGIIRRLFAEFERK